MAEKIRHTKISARHQLKIAKYHYGLYLGTSQHGNCDPCASLQFIITLLFYLKKYINPPFTQGGHSGLC